MTDPSSKEEKIGEQIDHYRIVRSLGEGGMGEIFLAFDTHCHRHVALKRIRRDLLKFPAIKKRFLKEAHLAARLAHPSIITIYAIHQEKDSIYYTMPYIEGETLKSILRTTREQEKKGAVDHPIGGSIPALSRIFLNVCQAVSFAHSKGILHRDIKPENIMIGKFGEVRILDWGLAEPINSAKNPDEELEEEIPDFGSELTRPGKVVGTLSFLPPERIFGKPADIQTDLYALGVMLFQILTLKLPFHRPNLETFRKLAKFEELEEPTLVAPYRDIPHQLIAIVKRALAPQPENRYQSVAELIDDLEKYIEGETEWQPTGELDIHNKSHWEFQENIALTKHIAITRSAADLEWVNVMVSKDSFAGNFRVETTVAIHPKGQGVGFLLGIEPKSKNILTEGYFLWLGSPARKGAALFRSNVEIEKIPDVSLSEEPTKIAIEKIDNSLSVYLDETKIFHHESHLPLRGSRIGLLFRDHAFSLEKLLLYKGSQNVLVNCLCIPDAFFANHLYDKALAEYQHISASFPGRQEGREAMFRAGFTLVEKARSEKKSAAKKQLLTQALEEFSKLHATPGEPLEYLGKSFVYRIMEEVDEEVKCLELALRKFPKHPLLSILIEHVGHRLHEASVYDRHATCALTLLALCHLPELLFHPDHGHLLQSLDSSLDPLPFFSSLPKNLPEEMHRAMIIDLSYRLAKPLPLIEMLTTLPEETSHRNAFLCCGFAALLFLGCTDWVEKHLDLLPPFLHHPFRIACSDKNPLARLTSYLDKFSTAPEEPLYFLLASSPDPEKTLKLFPKSPNRFIPQLLRLALRAKNIRKAKELFALVPKTLTQDASSPYFPLYGCYLALTKGEKTAYTHLQLIAESIIPPSSQLLSHYLMGGESWFKRWNKKAFYTERDALYKQLYLYYHCLSDPRAALYEKKRRQNQRQMIKTLVIPK